MKYLVEVEYKLRRKLTVHAANSELAKKKAAAIVTSWKDSKDPLPVSCLELKEE